MQENTLLRQLYILRDLLESRHSTKEFCRKYGISARQLSRDLKELRHMGAVLTFYRATDGYVWSCENAGTIANKGIVSRWIELEESRSVA